MFCFHANNIAGTHGYLFYILQNSFTAAKSIKFQTNPY